MARLLLVDDEVSLLDALEQILTLQGHQVVSVTSGDNAAAVLLDPNAQRPDLIVSDVRMQGLTGLGLVKLVRNNPTLRSIPFVLISASAHPGYANPAARFEKVLYVRKPFEIDALLDAVKNGLELNRQP